MNRPGCRARADDACHACATELLSSVEPEFASRLIRSLGSGRVLVQTELKFE